MKLCNIAAKIGGVKSTIHHNVLAFRKVSRQVCVCDYYLPKCQQGYSGTFDVTTVVEYYQPFIQKRLRKTSVVKSILAKTAINSVHINKYTRL